MFYLLYLTLQYIAFVRVVVYGYYIVGRVRLYIFQFFFPSGYIWVLFFALSYALSELFSVFICKFYFLDFS